MANVTEIKQKVLTKRGKYTVLQDNLHVKEVIVGDGERRRRYILCYNPKEAKRQKQHRKQIVAILEKELDRHPDKSATAQWAIELLASKRYKRYLSISKSKRIRIDRGKIRAAEKYDGKWVIETNDDTITVEDAACGYKGLMIIERCFRSLKRTQIKLTPMYHWLSRRIEAHVRICVLALLIERVAEVACDTPWPRIRYQLEKLQATEFFSIKNRFFRRNEIPASTRSILKKLKISIPKKILSIEKHP
jgi:transposase